MSASTLYRITAGLLLLFAVGHTLGFSQSDPQWGVDATLASLRATRFSIQGFNRTYWDFYLAAGLCVGVFYLCSAVFAWQLGGLGPDTLARTRGIRWTFALCFAAIAVVSWAYLFVIPIAFSTLIAMCLISAAWRRP